MTSNHLTAILAGLALAACATGGGSPDAGPQAASTQKPGRADAALQAVIEDHWALVLSENPTFATSLGVRDYDDRLGDPSLAAYEAGVEARRDLLARLEGMDEAGLSEEAALNRELLMLDLRTEVEAASFGGKTMLITNRGGPHLTLTSLPDRLPFRTRADYESYVTRLGQVPEYLEAATERLHAGIETGWVQPCASMAGYEDSINTHVVLDPEDSVFLDPFDERPAQVSEAAFEALRDQAREAVRAEIVPALRSFEGFYNLEYQPSCREEVGASAMPGGLDYYDHRVRLFTTLDTDAEAVHATGLAEVARIRAAMEAIAEAEGYDSLAAFQAFLRSDPRFYPKTPEERMAAASVIAKRMDGQLPKLFTKLPRAPYDIRPIPDDIAEGTTTAYYSQPAGDGSRPGTYWLNLTKLDTRPLYELEALTLHEAVPGHHLQIALAQEIEGVPDFRRYGGFTAFVEGWGLYSESLGEEAGFYATPYTRFGQLSYEQWRAARLVVDTGLHAKGWTRQQAIDFMAENTGLSLNNITTEVDRYITWPGQAVAYKTGELKIRELRERAEAALGEGFDLRLFHDAVLEQGAVPLSVLEAHIDEWIEAQRMGA
jgi:uncharacterized protein (DUF885 family)